ncbi:golgin subfamily A member 6-like protein 4 [Cyclospora cayetanensis]|uniref:Golgin subfamily A member 6-like protein 4 n=1 Tax=Cyclospora cayetanensis TaxID=88456 RepID=A0A6P6RY32_9EIME|nr:golgin subfamily A member 6-like protein 4 [Cyclospora cayetanensis]
MQRQTPGVCIGISSRGKQNVNFSPPTILTFATRLFASYSLPKPHTPAAPVSLSLSSPQTVVAAATAAAAASATSGSLYSPPSSSWRALGLYLHAAPRVLQQLLQSEQRALRDAETSLLHAFEEKALALKTDILQENQQRQGQEASIVHYCEAEVREREAMESRIVGEVAEQMQRLQNLIQQEKEAREKHLASLLSLIEEVVREVQRDVRREEEERKKSENSLVSLMEQTVDRITSAI